MITVHEIGHVLGAAISGGQCVTVVLHPLAISRTDVNPNPHPLIVAWMGPVVGVASPLVAARFLWHSDGCKAGILKFWAGFCCVSNGAYLGCGAFDAVGDSGESLRFGSPFWTLLVFGVVCSGLGLFIWHKMGSVVGFLKRRSTIIAAQSWWQMLLVAVVTAIVQLTLSGC